MGAADVEAQAKLDKERNWRFGYAKHADKSVRVALESRENAVKMAQAGLAAAHGEFRFFRTGLAECSLAEAMDGRIATSFKIGDIQGTGKKPEAVLRVPYGGKDPSKPVSN